MHEVDVKTLRARALRAAVEWLVATAGSEERAERERGGRSVTPR
jgi:hypothetical protein